MKNINFGLTLPLAWCYALLLATAVTGLTATASRHTSTTYDEIVLMAGGARGWETGRWDIAPEHPPLMLYAYGWPIHRMGPVLPAEAEDLGAGRMQERYHYSRQFFWGSGNDPERLAFLGRLPGALCAGLLVLVTFAVTLGAGLVTAMLAALLVAGLPDVLAHGGVAYNDMPLALTYLLTFAAADSAIRKPSIWRGMLCGAAAALALGVKFSAVAILPGIAALIALEAVNRKSDGNWLRPLVAALLVGLAMMYLVLVAIYRGDFALAEMRYGLLSTYLHVSQGHGVPTYIAGVFRAQAPVWFFPLAFLYKTPAALHLLMLLALLGLNRRTRNADWSNLTASRARMPTIAVLVFALALLNSNLSIGFRYALPLLPPLCILTAMGLTYIWQEYGRGLRAVISTATLAYVVTSVSAYPHYLGYTSEYGGSKGYKLFVDSSIDWGQGLLELRKFMAEQDIDRVYLAYFGSADPAGYGIEYVPLRSYSSLFESVPVATDPDYAVISVTHLQGVYFLQADPFAPFRRQEPVTVLANSLLVYRLHRGSWPQ